jgi:hypothetical protein
VVYGKIIDSVKRPIRCRVNELLVDEHDRAVVVQDGLHNPDCRILGPGQTRFLTQGRDMCAPVFRRTRWYPAHTSEANIGLSSVRATHHTELKSPSRINYGGGGIVILG